MALTFAKLSPNPDRVSGNIKVRVRRITFDNSYPAGGEAVAASDFGLKKIYHLEISPVAMKSDESLGVPVAYDADAGKIVAFEGDNDNAADAPLVQADDTDDLSTYYVFATAYGI